MVTAPKPPAARLTPHGGATAPDPPVAVIRTAVAPSGLGTVRWLPAKATVWTGPMTVTVTVLE